MGGEFHSLPKIQKEMPDFLFAQIPYHEAGTGSPEGVVSAAIGTIYFRTDGGPKSSHYLKQSGGAGNTGWVAIGADEINVLNGIAAAATLDMSANPEYYNGNTVLLYGSSAFDNTLTLASPTDANTPSNFHIDIWMHKARAGNAPKIVISNSSSVIRGWGLDRSLNVTTVGANTEITLGSGTEFQSVSFRISRATIFGGLVVYMLHRWVDEGNSQAPFSGTLGTNGTIDWFKDNGNKQTLVPTADITLNMDGWANGDTGVLILDQSDGGAPHTITFPSNSYIDTGSTVLQSSGGTHSTTGLVANDKALLFFEYDGTDFYWRGSKVGKTDVVLGWQFTTNDAGGGSFDPGITYGGGDTPVWTFAGGATLNGASITDTGAEGLDGSNQLVTVSTADLTQITNLDISNDNVQGALDFSSLTGLLGLNVSNNNGITGLTFPVLTITENFFINGIGIPASTLDLSNLTFDDSAGAGTRLTWLRQNAMTDITFSAGPNNLGWFDLFNCTNLTTLDLSNCKFSTVNPSSNFFAQGCSALASITLPADAGEVMACSLNSTGLTGSVDLSTLEIKRTLTFGNSTSVTDVILHPNTVVDTSESTTVQYVFNGNTSNTAASTTFAGWTFPGTITSLTIGFQGNNISTADVNRLLVELDTVLPGTAPATVANIDFGLGGNGAPDTTTGGNNGSAAVTSLQGKGYIVITN